MNKNYFLPASCLTFTTTHQPPTYLIIFLFFNNIVNIFLLFYYYTLLLCCCCSSFFSSFFVSSFFFFVSSCRGSRLRNLSIPHLFWSNLQSQFASKENLMEEGEIDDDRSLLPRSRPPVVRYRAPVNYGRQLDPHYHVRASRHHSPVGSPVGMPPMLPLNPPAGGQGHNIQSNMLRSNVIGRRLSQNEIRLMALQNMKNNNGSVLPQPRLTKRGSHINSFQPTKHLAATRPTIQTVAHSNNISSKVAVLPPNSYTNTLFASTTFCSWPKQITN